MKTRQKWVIFGSVSTVEFGGSVDVPAVTSFIDGGGNVLDRCCKC